MIPLIINRLTPCHLNSQHSVVALYDCCINRVLHNGRRLNHRNLNDGASHTANRIDHLYLIETAVLPRDTNYAQLGTAA